MRKTVLFIAMSLDGYIADRDGGVGWLQGQGGDEENVDTYSEFIKGVDTVLMGWNTYRQIVEELSPDEWVYQGLATYVFTHNKRASTEDVRFTDHSPSALIDRLRKEDGKDIWVCGGAGLVRQLVSEDLIDRYHITVVPTLLGAGIRLFDHTEREVRLRLLHTQSYNGMTELVYERRESPAGRI